MYNPYMSAPYIESVEALYERKEELKQLRRFFRNRTDAAIFGPEGSGKSVLLRCFFSREFRAKMAQEDTLIYLGEFPNNLDGEGTYSFFADAIVTAVEFLEVCGLHDRMTAILRSLNAARYDTKQARFDKYLNKIQDFGYRMVFVLDNFENFTSSPDVKPEHHDLLCGMLNDDKLQLIVATNFDFNETSLPVGTRNSKLLTRLSPHTIHMPPLSMDACQQLLERIAEEEEEDFRFTTQQLQTLHSLSGGIPLLLHLTAKHAFQALEEGETSFAEAVQKRALPEALPILKHWCKVTPEEQLELLATLPEREELIESKKTAACSLKERGLLCEAFDLGRDGRRISAEGYTYNSGLFRAFCGHREWLDEVLERNPLRKEPASAGGFDPMALLSGNSGVPVFIQEMKIHQGDVYDNRVQKQTIIADTGFSRLFSLLDLGKDELGEKLLEIFEGSTGAVPRGLTPEETAERIASMFIPEELESEQLEECQEEQKTLETRFNAIRSQVDPEGLVDDSLLASLTNKCRMYLQIAFVVEDALSVLQDFHLGDLSAQMVMYGKVLEQQLRDNLYRLFRKDEVLRNIDVFGNFTDPYSTKRFGYMNLKKTVIGNYTSLLRGQASRLAELCDDYGVSFETQNPDTNWWFQLGEDADQARELRNVGDHAGSETSQDNLTDMRKMLFGEGRLLRRCRTGGLLFRTVSLTDAGTDEDRKALAGQIVEMTDITVTSRNGLRGTIVGTSCGVSVSPKLLEDQNLTPQEYEGKTIQVRLTRWDSNPQSRIFNAELL